MRATCDLAPILGLAALAVAALAGAPARAALPPLELDAVVPAPVAAVWDAWTTTAGVTTFFAPAARVEPRIGGAYEMYFLVDGPPGQRGGEGLRFLDLEPPHRFLVQWNAPPTFGPLRGVLTWVEVRLAESDAGTAVHLVHGGFGEEAEGWKAVRDYFASAWSHVLSSLVQRFESGPRDWAERTAPAAAIQAEVAATAVPPDRDWLLLLRPATPSLVEGRPTEEEAPVLTAHFQRMQRMVAEGSGILGGPTLDAPPLGLFVFKAPDEAAARAVLEGDPCVRAGLMTATVHPFALALGGK